MCVGGDVRTLNSMYRPMAILARCQHPVWDEKLSGAEWSGVESGVESVL